MNSALANPVLPPPGMADPLLRLQTRDDIDGMVLLGSLAHNAAHPASDCDLLIILANSPVPVRSGVAVVDGQVLDLVFATVAEVDSLGVIEESDRSAWCAMLGRWLAEGAILFDRRGRLGHAQHLLAITNQMPATTEHDRYAAWFSINANLLHNRKLLQSPDPLDAIVLEARLLYCASDAFMGYFLLRSRPWEGEKAAIHSLQHENRPYLALFTRYLQAATLAERMAHYEALVDETLAGNGGVWPADATAFQCEPMVPVAAMADLCAWWTRLAADDGLARGAGAGSHTCWQDNAPGVVR